MEGLRDMEIDKRVNLNDALEPIENGASILIGGWGPFRKPMSLIGAIAQSSLQDLTILSFAGIDLDLLICAGKVKTGIYGFASLEGAFGGLLNFKAARADGSIELKEMSEYMFISQFKAAAERLPFYPTRSGLGTDLLTVNPEIKTISDPYTNQTLVAVPAFTPNYAIIHVNEADAMGNSRIIGDPYLDNLFVRAADKVIITAERILPVGKVQESNIKGFYVDMVIESPGAARPGSCYPDYEVSQKGFKQYSEAAKDSNLLNEYLNQVT